MGIRKGLKLEDLRRRPRVGARERDAAIPRGREGGMDSKVDEWRSYVCMRQFRRLKLAA